MDVFEQSDLNPFFVVRKSLSNMLHAGALGDMGALYDVVPEAHHGSLCDEIRGMIVDFIAQLEWRFAHVSQYPLKFARYVHPRTTKADRLRMATNFCSKRRCCVEKDFAGKILNLFEKRPKALLRDVDFRCAIIAWISAFRWASMHMERLLAQTFHWASAQDGRFEDAERLVAEGFMGQLFSDHLFVFRSQRPKIDYAGTAEGAGGAYASGDEREAGGEEEEAIQACIWLYCFSRCRSRQAR